MKPEFPSNSQHLPNQQPQERPQAQPVAKGSVKKQSLSDKIADAFLYADVKTVVKSVVHEAILPDLKAGLLNALSTAFWHTPFRGGYSQQTPVRSVVNQYHQPSSQTIQQSVVVSPGARVMVKEILYPTLEDAQKVKDQIIEYCNRYLTCSVSQYYTFSSVSPDNYTTANFGWKKDKLKDDEIMIMANSDGTYSLKLPPPEPLK